MQEEYKETMKKKAETLACPYENCSDYGIAGKNIVFVTKYGKEKTQNLFKCKTCKRTFSERRGTPLHNCKLPDEKVYQIIRCLSEGAGVRATGRIVGVNKDTVEYVIERVGTHIEQVTEYLMNECHLEECQLDEL